ncbi:MAG: hypothetical protein IPM69_08315 [Ignavibacteria bacterium]|nr:hypothetical protein [Ignavibacteria bacterium]
MKIIILLLLVITTTYAQHPDDYRWDDRFSKPGISHPEFNGAPIRGALALAANADYVIVGGRFTVPGNNIALWNKKTNSWEKAGSGVWKNPSQNDYPEVTKVFADGDNVFVSGNFTTAGDIPAAGYALFNTRTKQWTSDSLFSGDISGVTRFGNDLIIHGSFSIQGTPIRNIAYWNNGKWSLFNKDTNTSARGIVALKGSLYSNVLFKDTYSFPAYYQALSRWDGTTWIPIVDTMYPTSLFLNLPIQRIQGNKDYLYLFGWIDSMKLASGSTIKGGGMLRYDGATWTTVIDSSLNNSGSMIVDGEDVYCIGYFSSIQGYVANKVAKWDHTTGRWNGLGSGINDDDNSTKLYAHLVTDNQMFVAGLFATAGSQNVNNIARYDQSTFTWYPLGDAKTQAPICKWSDYTNVFNDNNKLLVIGDFEYAGDKRLNSIGYWTGKAWENVGTGILGGAGYGPYTGITRVFTTTPGLSQFARIDTTLYLGGTFELLGTNRCDNITSYKDGITECVGGGITQSHQGTSGSYYYPATIDAMIAIGNSLYVGGNFTKAGSVQCGIDCKMEWYSMV